MSQQPKRDEILAAQYQSILPDYLLSISPNLAALHASRHRRLNGGATLPHSCSRCGHLLPATRVGMSSGNLKVTQYCNACGVKSRPPIDQRRRSDTRNGLPSVRQRLRGQRAEKGTISERTLPTAGPGAAPSSTNAQVEVVPSPKVSLWTPNLCASMQTLLAGLTPRRTKSRTNQGGQCRLSHRWTRPEEVGCDDPCPREAANPTKEERAETKCLVRFLAESLKQ